MTSIDLASAMKASDNKRWMTPKMRTWCWGFAFGVVTCWIGVTVTSTKLGPVIDRIGRGVEAITSEPTETSVTP